MISLSYSRLPVEDINRQQLQDLVEQGRLMVADGADPKVLELPQGTIIKLFRRKRWFSSAMFAPYAVRFVNNAFRLKELEIPAITPLSIKYCKVCRIHVVEYEKLHGKPLRRELAQNRESHLFTKTAQFIAGLHYKGIYFRSLHFENIVVGDSSLGLIDVADMKTYSKPLGAALRKRNFQHFLRYPQDRALLGAYGMERFNTEYSTHLNLLMNVGFQSQF